MSVNQSDAATHTSMVTLRIRDMGHVPSFKNNKMLTMGRIRTNPKNQKWMARCVRDFELQLLSLSTTTDDGTPMAHCLRSLIAWSNRFDDSIQFLPEIAVQVKYVAKGQEGANVTIEKL